MFIYSELFMIYITGEKVTKITIRTYLLHESSFVPLSTCSSPSKAQLCICIVHISRYVRFIPVYCNSEVVKDHSIKYKKSKV